MVKSSSQSQEKRNSDFLPVIQPDEFLPHLSKWITINSILVTSTLGLAFVLAITVKFDFTVKAPALIRPLGETKYVEASYSGIIEEIIVKPNQTIEQGDILAIIDDSKIETRRNQLQNEIKNTRQELAQIEAQTTFLNEEILAQSESIRRIIAVEKAKLAFNQRQYNEEQIVTRAEVKEANAKVALAREELTKFQELANTGAISTLQIKEKESALHAAFARLEIVRAALNPSDAEIIIANERIKQQLSQGKATIAGLRRERELLSQKQTNLEKLLAHSQQEFQQTSIELKKTIIRAPVSGTIQKLNLRNLGQVVTEGKAVASIIIDNNPLLVKAFVTSDNINKITVQQSVQTEIKSCPYPDYGILQGTVTNISSDTVISDNIQDIYEVTIKPENFSLNAKNRQCDIKPGMKATVNFITQQETILRFIFRKIRISTNF